MRPLVVISALVTAACGPDPGLFDIYGDVYPGALDRGSIIALWTLRGDPVQLYKYGDGHSVDTQFAISFDEEPPPDAIDTDGVGVAILVQLPDLATIPDGIVRDPSSVRASGISANHALVFKRADASGPPWAANFGFAFSCARCVRSATGGLDAFELAPCFEMAIRAPGSELCNWY